MIESFFKRAKLGVDIVRFASMRVEYGVQGNEMCEAYVSRRHILMLNLRQVQPLHEVDSEISFRLQNKAVSVAVRRLPVSVEHFLIPRSGPIID